MREPQIGIVANRNQLGIAQLAGCTTPQIAAITGHSLKTISSIRYLARTRILSTEALARFENATSTDFANRLQTRGGRQVGKDAKLLT